MTLATSGKQSACKSLHKQSNVVEQLVQELLRRHISTVFGVPGGAIEPFFDAVAKSKVMNIVIARHEAAAAFMACGFAKRKGQIGVCCTTTGPGATNIVTGVAAAFEEEIPLLVITAQAKQTSVAQRPFQDSSVDGVDLVNLFKPVTLYSASIDHPDQFSFRLSKALTIACGNRPGPVHLSIPMDVMRQIPGQHIGTMDFNTRRDSSTFMEENELSWLQNIILKEKAVFIVGPRASESVELITALAEHGQVPIVTTPGAKGLISPNHPNFFGCIGFAGRHEAYSRIRNSSHIFAIGCTFSEWEDTSSIVSKPSQQVLININSQPDSACYAPNAQRHLIGNIKHIISTLLTQIISSDSSLYTPKGATDIHQSIINTREIDPPCNNNSHKVNPQYLMQVLGKRIPVDTTVVTDIGNSSAWAIHYLNPEKIHPDRHHWFFTSTQFASMGWGIGYAIGLALAEPERSILCITGDGSMLMNGFEISVAVEYNLNIIFVVLNDSALGMVKHGQHLNHAQPIGHLLPTVNFKQIANAVGMRAFSIDSSQQLNETDFNELFENKGPVLLDIRIDPEVIPPIGNRIEALKLGVQ